MGDFEKPKKIIWPSFMPGFGDWIYYLKGGFEQLGIPVEMSDEMRHVKRTTYGFAKGLFFFDMIFSDGSQRVWYHCGDFTQEYYQKVVSGNEPYFKINIAADQEMYPNLFPIGQRVIGLRYFNFLPEMRKLAGKREYKYDIVAIFRATERKNRLRAVKIIRGQPWKSLAWMTDHPARKRIPEPWRSTRWLDFKSYLAVTAQSRLGMSMPGVGPFACRIVETLGMGACCIMPEADFILPGNPVNCWVEFKRDFSDFVEVVNHYIGSQDERDEIAGNGLKYYEEYLSPVGQAKYVLRKVTEMRR